VVDQLLAVGAGALGLLASGITFGAHAREGLGLARAAGELALKRAALARLLVKLFAQPLGLGRAARRCRPRLGLLPRLAPGHRQLDHELAPDLELSPLRNELCTVPRERRDP